MAKKIFLSYRREDRPGYVARLKDNLEAAFGEGRVFRDVEDIAGGSKWREVLEHNLREAGVLLLVIGPRWESIWTLRSKDAVNYVAFELERAHQLGVPVIPVTLDGTTLSKDINLGEISWLLDNQMYDISDKQGRWSTDVKGLIRLLEALPGIGKSRIDEIDIPDPDPDSEPKKKSHWGKTLGAIGLLVVVLLGYGLSVEESDIEEIPTEEDDVLHKPVFDKPEPKMPIVAAKPPEQEKRAAAVAAGPGFPDISGVWMSQEDSTIYRVTQYDDGSFDIESPGYTNGSGHFLENMPRKFRVHMVNAGWGEFSVSNTDKTASGWFIEEETGEQIFDSLIRIE